MLCRSVFHLRQLRRIAPLAAILTAATLLPASAAAITSLCIGTPADRHQILNAIDTMYAAAATDDLGKFHTVTSPSFYAFDNGKRFDGDALMDTVKAFHASGKVFVWKATDQQLQATCDFAWVTYTNRGSMRDASGTTQLTWLESAVLEKQAGAWRIRFLHSTRVP